MDQTRFDVLQTTLQVVSDLHMNSAQRLTHGKQFPLTLIVHTMSGEDKPLDIFVDRVPEGETGKVHVTVDGAMLIGTTATIDPDGERFGVEIILDRARNPSSARPAIRVSRNMFGLLRKAQDREAREVVERLLEELDML